MEDQLGHDLQACFHDEGIGIVTGCTFEQVRTTDQATADGDLRSLRRALP